MSNAETTGAAAKERLTLAWQHPRGLFGLSIVNMALRLVTLGIYHFWAKTEVRKRIWSGVRINDEPLTYTGRGLELFLGFLIVFAVVILPISLGFVALALIFGPQHPILNVAAIILYVGFAYLYGIAIYRAHRYRLARTRWRGIRGALEGSPARYAWTHFWTLLLIPLTLGWIIPWRTTKLQSLITNNMRFGDRPLRFDATYRPLLLPFAVLWFGVIFIYVGLGSSLVGYFAAKYQRAQEAGQLYRPSQYDSLIVIIAILAAIFLYALISAWYQARTINHFARHTHFEQASFDGRATASGLIWLSITNLLILLSGAILLGAVVLAIAAPFIDLQNMRAPEGVAVTQVLSAAVPLALIIGFTLFTPIVQARTAGYIVRRLSISGTAPIAEIAQSAGADVKYGEGLAEAFDVDAF